MFQDGTKKKRAYCVLEFMEGGELLDFISLGSLPENISRYFFRQLIFGLHHLHSHGIVHLDMKSDNVLVDPRDYSVKICDFGLAQGLNGTGGGLIEIYSGTPGYMCPEMIEQIPFTGEAADLFATAVILFTLCSGSAPFKSAEFLDPQETY